MDFLSNMPLGALFGLMVVPIIGAVIIGAYLVFAVNRRQKKAIEQEIQPETIADEAPLSVDIPAPLNKEAPPKNNVIDASPSKDIAPSPSQQKPQFSQSLENRLNLALLSEDPDTEDTMPDTPSELDNFDTDATLLSQQPQPQSSEPVELMRLLRHPQSKQLIVEVGGKRYTKLADVTDKKVGQYILQLVAHLLAFVPDHKPADGTAGTRHGVASGAW